MMEFDHFIAQSLAPTFALSGIALLVSTQNNRLMTITGRARDLNLRMNKPDFEKHKSHYQSQIQMFLDRAHLVRNSIFLLYAAIGCMVLTAILIALIQIFKGYPGSFYPLTTFLLGLILVFVAVLIESTELTVSLQTLKIDIMGNDDSFGEASSEVEADSAGV